MMLPIPNKSWCILFGAGMFHLFDSLSQRRIWREPPSILVSKLKTIACNKLFSCRAGYWPILNSWRFKSWLQIKKQICLAHKFRKLTVETSWVKPEISKLSSICILLIIVNHWFLGSRDVGALDWYGSEATWRSTVKLKFQRIVFISKNDLSISNFKYQIGLSADMCQRTSSWQRINRIQWSQRVARLLHVRFSKKI